MIPGTTPTMSFNIPGDWTIFDSVWVTFEHSAGQLTKHGTDISEVVYSEETGKSTVSLKLTQEDTLSFPEKEKVTVQVRAEKDNGETAAATRVGKFKVEEVLLEKVIPLGV